MPSEAFYTKSPALADGAPSVSPVSKPSVHADPRALARPGSVSSGAGVASPTSGPIGAYTGLELPKAMRDDGAPGPDLQPMRPGLPYTPLASLQELMLAIVVQGIADDDLDYVISPTFIHHLLYVGLDPDMALKVKLKYLRREINPQALKFAVSVM